MSLRINNVIKKYSLNLKDLFLPASILLFILGVYTTLVAVEFFNVVILRNIAGYPFGVEGPDGWNYRSAEVYMASLKVDLVFSVTLLLSVCVLIWKLKVKGLLISFLLFLAYIAFNSYNESYFMKKLVFWII